MPSKSTQVLKPPKQSGSNEWLNTYVNGGMLLLGCVQDAAAMAPVPYLRAAAGVTIRIVEAVQQLKDNKADFRRLAADATSHIAAVYSAYKNSHNQAAWPPPELGQVISELIETLKEILIFVDDQVARNRAVRFLNSKNDINKVKEYRERLQAAVEKFQVSSHLNLSDAVALLLRQQREIQAKLGIASTREDQAAVILFKIDEHKQAKAAEERRMEEERIQKEIEEKQVIESIANIRKAEAARIPVEIESNGKPVSESIANIQKTEEEAEESRRTNDERQRLQEHNDKRDRDIARLQAELEELRRNSPKVEPARVEVRPPSLRPPKRSDSAETSSSAIDETVLNDAFERYQGRVNTLKISAECEPTSQHRSSVQDDEEESETVITLSSESSTDEEERERRREAERRAKAKKTQKKKPKGTKLPVSPPQTLSPSPEPQHQATPSPQPSVEEQLLAHLARLGLNPNTAYGSPPPQHTPNSAPPPQLAPHSPPPPQQYYHPQGGYYSPQYPTPPPTSPYNLSPSYSPPTWGTPHWNPTPMFSPQAFSPPPGSINTNVGNVINTNISNVANDNRRNVYPGKAKRRTRRNS